MPWKGLGDGPMVSVSLPPEARTGVVYEVTVVEVNGVVRTDRGAVPTTTNRNRAGSGPVQRHAIQTCILSSNFIQTGATHDASAHLRAHTIPCTNSHEASHATSSLSSAADCGNLF